MKLRSLFLLASTLGLFAPIKIWATTFDAVTEFSSSNPSGTWAYGSGITGVSFSPLSNFIGNGCVGAVDLSCWQAANPVDNVPVVGVNTSTATINFGPRSNVVLPAGVLLVHPGPTADTIVQWTAPAAGIYKISGYFELLDATPTGVNGEIFASNKEIFAGALAGPPAIPPNIVGGRESFSLTETLAAGAVISFGVNNAGNFLDDSTGFAATISPASAVPEPVSTALFGIGLLAIWCLQKSGKLFAADSSNCLW